MGQQASLCNLMKQPLFPSVGTRRGYQKYVLTIDLGHMATAPHTQAQVQALETCRAQDKHRLKSLVYQYLGLHELQRAPWTEMARN